MLYSLCLFERHNFVNYPVSSLLEPGESGVFIFMKVKHICKTCGKEFFAYLTNNRKFCCMKCKRVKSKKVINVCIICGKEFLVIPSRIKAKFCSQPCFSKRDKVSKLTNITRTCKICKKHFTRNNIYPSRIKSQPLLYCSRKCANKDSLPHFTADKHWNWKGGRRLTVNGYIEITDCKGQEIYEHRHLVEQFIGRSLYKDEVIHHINLCKTDNELDNLYLCSKKEHGKIHRTNLKVKSNLLFKRNIQVPYITFW